MAMAMGVTPDAPHPYAAVMDAMRMGREWRKLFKFNYGRRHRHSYGHGHGYNYSYPGANRGSSSSSSTSSLPAGYGYGYEYTDRRFTALLHSSASSSACCGGSPAPFATLDAYLWHDYW